MKKISKPLDTQKGYARRTVLRDFVYTFWDEQVASVEEHRDLLRLLLLLY